MNVMAKPTNLKNIRESLGVTQETVARRAQAINLRTYIRAENGESSVRYATALRILAAINELLKENDREPVELDDLGLVIY